MENQGARFKKEILPLLNKVLNVLNIQLNILNMDFVVVDYALFSPIIISQSIEQRSEIERCNMKQISDYFESKNREKAKLFRTVDDGEWTEAVEDRNLFLFWRQIQHDLSKDQGALLADGDKSQTPTLVDIPV